VDFDHHTNCHRQVSLIIINNFEFDEKALLACTQTVFIFQGKEGQQTIQSNRIYIYKNSSFSLDDE
jgi:hypothetical protein